MGDDRYRKDRRREKDSRYHSRDKRRKKYDDDDDYDDDDSRNRRYKNENQRDKREKTTTVERILTPGTATNNVIKTIATGVIAGGTLLLMGVYGLFGDRLAGANFLPLATIAGSAMATACVWMFGRPKAESERNAEIAVLNKQIESLSHTITNMQGKVGELDTRLGNAEYIENFEERLARKTIDKKLSSSLPEYEETNSNEEASSSSPPLTE